MDKVTLDHIYDGIDKLFERIEKIEAQVKRIQETIDDECNSDKMV